MTNRNRSRLLVAVAIIVVGGGYLYASSGEDVNVVHDIEPVSRNFLAMEETTDTLANMSSPEERNEYLARNHPTLSNDVVYWLRDREWNGGDAV